MKMAKTNLLAVAAGVLISPVSMAAIVDDVDTGGPSTTFFYSTEYLSTAVAADAVDAGDLAVTLGAEYAVGDVVTWTVSGSAVDSGFPNSVVVDCVPETALNANDGTAGVTFGLLSSDADGATYRVTELDSATCAGATSTVGVTAEFATAAGDGALQLDAQSVEAAGTFIANYAAETSTSLPLDTAGGASRSVDLVITGSQFGPDVTGPFDATVDVNQQRLGFEGCDQADPDCEDVLDWTVDAGVVPDEADDDQIAGTPGDETAQAVTISADFGWVVDEDPDTDGVQAPVGTFASSCTITGLTATEATADCTNGANDLTIDVFSNEDSNGDRQVLPATTFTSDHVFAYTGIGNVDSTLTVSTVSLGAWDLNGFQAQVAYMPFQTGIGQVIYIANRSTQTGAITIDWIDQNGNSGSFDIGNVNAGSTRAIGPAIQAGLPAAQQEGGRLALVITANVPACQAQLNAQYNVSGDRAFSVSSNNCSE